MVSVKNKTMAGFLAAILLLAGIPPWIADAEEIPSAAVDKATKRTEIHDVLTYADYMTELAQAAPIEQAVKLDGDAQTLQEGDTLTLPFTLFHAGLFRLELTYTSLKRQDPLVAVLLDGKVPFYEAQRLIFPTHWENVGNVRLDGQGNEFVPEQGMTQQPVTLPAQDYSGEISGPYMFFAEAGVHTLTLRLDEGECKLTAVRLVPSATVKSYAQVVDKQQVAASGDVGEYRVLEGEDADLKSAVSLIPQSDDNSADVHPSSAASSKINYIGGSNWSGPNDSLTWKFTVPKDGYYSLAFLYRQSELLNGVSYRHLLIDGETPFAEAETIKFPYDNSWKYREFAGEDSPYWMWLTAGEEHTLTLSVTMGELATVYKALKDVATNMADLYVEITMVVGETVDVSRSYELFNQIPRFNERLQESIDELTHAVELMEALQEKKSGSTVSTINNAIVTLEKMVSRPYSAHRYKSAYYSAYTNLSALLGTFTDMPLDIDRIYIVGKGAEPEAPLASFFQRFSFSIKRFLFSFRNDYSKQSVDGEQEQEPLEIWVNWGRDQVQALEALIQSDFVPKEKVPVTLRLVNATLYQAILSDSGPDCMLRLARIDPVNLGMRGALVDISHMEGYQEVMERFTPGSDVPFTYKNGVYALPDTMGFNVLYVRTDILDSLGLEVPTTWEEYLNAATILQHNNLQVSLPYTQIADSSTVNVGVGGLSLYPTMLMQQGLSMYNDNLTASTLTEEKSIKVFTTLVDMYTKYRIPATMDFYNRFRVGSAPMGIASYTLYTQLKATAPEIDGRWTIALVPGTRLPDGTIDHTVSGSGTGCAITSISDQQENAWKFLKWWTDASTQRKYSESLEMVLGPLGRVDSANLEALDTMVWDKGLYSVIQEQASWVKQIPEVPGGYYVARGIDQAFWNVVERNAVPTDMMLKWGAIVDAEITRKRQEFE